MAAALIPDIYNLLFAMIGSILIVGGAVASVVAFTGMFYKLG